MHQIKRSMVSICSDHLSQSKEFYQQLFNFKAEFESDWFIQLVSPDQGIEIGIIDRRHDIVPKSHQQHPQGFYFTFVVEDVDAVFQTAKAASLNIIQEPEDTFYGQRRLLLQDPDGALVDISTPIPNFQF